MKTELIFDIFFSSLKSKKSLLMLDYDGTLAPFSITREKAYPYPGVRERLNKLLKIEDIKLVIVSGRSLVDLEQLLQLEKMPEIWGSHGLERRTTEGIYKIYQSGEPLAPVLKRATELCRKYLEPNRCELKPFSLALHFRGLNDEEIAMKLEEELKNLSSTLFEIHHFDGGLELRPFGRNKGEVVDTLMKQCPPNTPSAFLGDDLTDEDAFRTLGDKGLKVLVRQNYRPTLADIQLKPPEELLEFLDRWIEAYHGR